MPNAAEIPKFIRNVDGKEAPPIAGVAGNSYNLIAVSETGVQKASMMDSTGAELILENNGAVPVNIQDQHSVVLDFFFRKVVATVALASAATRDTYTLNLVEGHGAIAGEVLVLKESNFFYQAIILNVVSNVITVDRPLDHAFSVSTTAQRCTINMNVDGSTTPQIFFISPASTTLDLDINAIHFHIEDNVAMDSSTFGGLAALTRGVVVRRVDGMHKVLFNVKTNGEFAHHCMTSDYDSKAPAGMYGFRAVKNFNSQSGNRVSIRLNYATNDQLQIIIQDNLTGLTEFHATAQGHIVTN